MEDNAKLIETLIERATEYGKSSLELIKLKTLNKTSDIVSSFLPNIVVFILIASFILFLNFGLAFWVGEMLGKIYYGFFVLAAFYVFLAIVLHFFMHTWFKKKIADYIIKQMLK
jgi:fatty acid desaturase